LPAAHFSTELFSLAARVAVDETHVGAGAVSPEKPHQGVASKKPASHQAEIARNSTTALGLSWSWQSGTAPGARVTYDYDAWGNTVNTTGSTPNVYLYRGEQFDYDLGLYYLRARYFNPLTGRLLSRDPYAGEPPTPATLHKYLYANGDPVNLGDPSGMLVPTPTPAPPQAPPRTMAGTMTEYTLLVMAISSPFAVMLLPDGPVNMSAQEINCVWQWATGWLEMAAMRAMGQNVVPQYTKGQCGPTPKKCKPCPSNPKPRCDSVPPSRPHFPCKHDHIHFFYYYQDPVTCECHVNEWEPPTCLDPPMTCKNQGYGY
jgi:RHS repeat-associated protein